MLKLTDVSRIYAAGGGIVALDGVSLEFGDCGFVAVVGPSGCGKTTLLNIIGGLDRCTGGELSIKGVSTKAFGDADWDAYRNRSVGFVFQSYNLIVHQSVLANVEMALTISGMSLAQRRARAKEVLVQVGLGDKLYAMPNQLSGGQMQRVAIARALVMNPEIIMADEPTGALDSGTSTQIMQILSEIAQTRLVIMVTHNTEIAATYATRTIRLQDGKLQHDSDPPPPTPVVARSSGYRHTHMSFLTAAMLSCANLLTKKGRTITTAFAGSIGIISVALVLALSGGINRYMYAVQSDILMTFPISITTGENFLNVMGRTGLRFEPFPDTEQIYRFNQSDFLQFHVNEFTDEFLEYIAAMPQAIDGEINIITRTRGVQMNILSTAGDAISGLNTAGGGGMSDMIPGMGSGGHWQEMPQDYGYIMQLYELVGAGSRMPQAPHEILLVIDRFNRLSEAVFANLGMPQVQREYFFEDFLGQSFLTLVAHDNFYLPFGSIFVPASVAHYNEIIRRDGNLDLVVVGILRRRPDAAGSFFSQGFVYTGALVDYVFAQAHSSDIAAALLANPQTNVFTGGAFANDAQARMIPLSLGVDTTPVAISIFAADFATNAQITAYLEAFNEGRPESEHIVFNDFSEMVQEMTGSLVGMVSGVLIGFSAISLVVSTIMIGIVTGVSVVERTKEIGILRSIGARKKDISRVFCAEAVLTGFAAGMIGVVVARLLIVPINIIIERVAEVANVAFLSMANAVVLICISCALTFFAGLAPARAAAGQDPVVALRAD